MANKPQVFHKTDGFVWTLCAGCARQGIRRAVVRARARNYALSIPDAHRIFELGHAIFYPRKPVQYEPGCEQGEWHIIDAL